MNYANFKYFIDYGYVTNNAIEKNVRGSKNKKEHAIREKSGENFGTKMNKLSFPLLERFDELFSLDDEAIFNYNENS